MMPAEQMSPHLIERLARVRGGYTADAPLARFTWFRAGGPAEVLFEPADIADLQAFQRGRPDDVPVTVMGVASNLIVRDGGIAGVTVRLGRAFSQIDIDGETIRAGAGAIDISIARRARDAALTGLEFLVGIPGTLGGGLRMNAGAYDREIADIVISARAIDGLGELHEIDAAGLGFGYRNCQVPEHWIFVDAVLKGIPGDIDGITRRMTEIQETREASQPVRSRTGGSTFANPPDSKAWELIEAAGCRGLRRGGASVSTRHCNFLINDGGATAADIEGLGEEVRRRVKEKFGITLRWEIQRVGETEAQGPREIEK